MEPAPSQTIPCPPPDDDDEIPPESDRLPVERLALKDIPHED
jgi:hypothetical protein